MRGVDASDAAHASFAYIAFEPKHPIASFMTRACRLRSSARSLVKRFSLYSRQSVFKST
jgi:hypothetical protein